MEEGEDVSVGLLCINFRIDPGFRLACMFCSALVIGSNLSVDVNRHIFLDTGNRLVALSDSRFFSVGMKDRPVIKVYVSGLLKKAW